MSEWKKVGSCPVDSGNIMLVDPCYILPDTEKDIASYTYQQLMALFEEQGWGKNSYKLPSVFGHMGVVVNSGLGDGSYDVYAKIVNLPGWGERVAEIKVVFIEEEQYD